MLDDVSFTVDAGQFFTLLGPSGSGKTTILKIVAGFVPQDDGEVYADDRELSGEPPYRRDIGLVFQNYALFPHMTVAGNVGFPLRMRKVARAEAERRVRQALEIVRLTGFEDRYPRQLSGGQQQRVAIARALCMNPKIMLFDEPTSALDPEMIKEVLDVMVELAESGMTMLVVSHEMGFARTVAHRMMFMDAGQIVESSPPAEFFTQPRSERTRLFLSQILHH
ncbi:MAG TPA: amino acid ABC transporter ATP-binding protein [Methylomirabilota bacterium]